MSIAGVAPALAAAVAFAVFQLVQRRALGGVDVYRATATVLGVAALVLLAVVAATTGLAPLTAAPATAVLACAAAGLVHFGIGWTLLGASQVRLGAARTGIVVGTVPLFGALVAAVALDETLGVGAVAALVVVVAGVGVVVGRAGGSGADPAAGAGLRVGVAAGLGTALCWSVSPVLIRQGLRELGSPLLAAALGMAVCAVVYGTVLALTRGRRSAVRAGAGTTRLLMGSGTVVALAILLQWTAYDRAPVAVVLALLQLTPPLVVALAARVAGDPLVPGARRRTWLGAGLTLAGSLALVLAV